MAYVYDYLKGDMMHEHPIKVVGSEPASAKEGSLIIDTSDDGMKVYYGGSWQLLHTLVAATPSFLLLETGDFILLEDGFKLQLN